MTPITDPVVLRRVARIVRNIRQRIAEKQKAAA